ncbi:hypothetical protein [Arsukibacterium indicum]|uniref:Uncharacterized protein n=1 Tax=Arsukibacterium indicum TaxID=2848612 RepID=A0ABS6MI61_9GAMM|nr:hypothetical protein [Arsukibacterium indicum]MBV2127922.1 hypothetical protein [Arsukibacterium indicum]
MPEKITETFKGSAILYYKGRDLGNCSSAEITYEVDTQVVQNYRGGGGNFDADDNITAVNVSVGMTTLNIANTALLNAASVTMREGSSATGEPLTVTAYDRLIDVEFMIDVNATVTVTDDTDPTPVEIPRIDPDDGTVNYIVSAAGIIVPPTSMIAESDVILVTYSVPASYLLEALVTFGEEGPLVIDGLNDRNGKRRLIRCHRWKPSPTGVSAITTEFADVTVAGQLLADNTKGIGKSKFWQAVMT